MTATRAFELQTGDIDRFWAKVDKNGPIPELCPELGHCWIWTAVLSFGYGSLNVGGFQIKAHRVGYTIQIGPIPIGICVLHNCDNRACVRGSHHFLGDYKDNAVDAAKKGRHRNPVMPGASHPAAKLTPSDVLEIRRRAKQGESHTSIARDFVVQRRQISRIASGDRW